jgi:hypothetical protein
LIGRVASITQVIAAMPPPGGRRPHDWLQTGFDNRLESHLNSAIHPPTRASKQPISDLAHSCQIILLQIHRV